MFQSVEPGNFQLFKPYLIRAIHEWALDNGYTPQIMVRADLPGVLVPVEFIVDDKITLNIHTKSVTRLELGNEYLLFSARFGGRAMDITIPIEAVEAIFARENGQGLVFQHWPDDPSPEPTSTDPDLPDGKADGDRPKPGKLKLRVIK